MQSRAIAADHADGRRLHTRLLCFWCCLLQQHLHCSAVSSHGCKVQGRAPASTQCSSGGGVSRQQAPQLVQPPQSGSLVHWVTAHDIIEAPCRGQCS